MPFRVEVTAVARSDLDKMRMSDQRLVVEAIERHLVHQPLEPTRNRKRLDALRPGFAHNPPVWELRVRDYRVFYDVDEPGEVVFVRAIRFKSSRQTTQDIIA